MSATPTMFMVFAMLSILVVPALFYMLLAAVAITLRVHIGNHTASKQHG
jgi:hypothetical protein